MLDDILDFFGVLEKEDRLEVNLLQLVELLHVDLARDALLLVELVEHAHQTLTVLISTVRSRYEKPIRISVDQSIRRKYYLNDSPQTLFARLSSDRDWE